MKIPVTDLTVETIEGVTLPVEGFIEIPDAPSTGKFRKRPVVVDAVQWFKRGDHPNVTPYPVDITLCKECSKPMHDHGWIQTLEGGHIVCPSDWIITGVKGEQYPCKADIFAATYEAVER